MVRWMRWHRPPDTGFEIRALTVCCRARDLSVTEAPHNIESSRVSGEETFCFFEGWSCVCCERSSKQGRPILDFPGTESKKCTKNFAETNFAKSNAHSQSIWHQLSLIGDIIPLQITMKKIHCGKSLHCDPRRSGQTVQREGHSPKCCLCSVWRAGESAVLHGRLSGLGDCVPERSV